MRITRLQFFMCRWCEIYDKMNTKSMKYGYGECYTIFTMCVSIRKISWCSPWNTHLWIRKSESVDSNATSIISRDAQIWVWAPFIKLLNGINVAVATDAILYNDERRKRFKNKNDAINSLLVEIHMQYTHVYSMLLECEPNEKKIGSNNLNCHCSYVW